MRARWWMCVLALGCAPAASDSETRDRGGPDDVGTDAVDDGLPAPAELEAQLQDALARSLAIDGRVLQRAYDDAMDMGGVSCPASSQDFGDFWYDSCSTSEGADFDGYAYAFGGGPTQPGSYDDYWYVYGEATITDPDGHQLDLGGYGGWGTYAEADMTWTYHYAYGTFGSAAPAWDDTWLGTGDSVDFYATAGKHTLTGSKYVYLDGAMGSLFGERARAADFVAVEMGAMIDPACTEGPRGSIWLRMADGTWVDVRFDCAPCGVALLGSEDLGEVCADFSGWTRWEDSPW